MIAALSIARFSALSEDRNNVGYLALFLGVIIFLILIHRLKKIGKIIENTVERFSLFFYIYHPIGILGFLIVVFRNFL